MAIVTRFNSGCQDRIPNLNSKVKAFNEWLAEQLNFKTEMTDAYHGQSNFRLDAHEHGKRVGYLEYTEFEKKAHINYVFVEPSERRKGIGLALVKQLAHDYPYTDIVWSSTTDDGAKLKPVADQYFAPFIKAGKDEWGKKLKVPKAKFHRFAYSGDDEEQIKTVAQDHDGLTVKISPSALPFFRKYAAKAGLKIKELPGKIRFTSAALIKFMMDARNKDFKVAFGNPFDPEGWNAVGDFADDVFEKMKAD